MNKLLKTTICSLIALMVLAFGVIVEAGRIPSHMVPLTTYATKKVTCYLPLEKPNGWIDPGDLVIVSKIYSSGWAYGSYPTPRGRVSKFFKIDDLLYNPNFRTLDRMAPKYRVNVYRNYDYKETIGSVSNNEDIWVVSNLGDVWQIVYKVDSGGYKMGWVPYWDCLQKPVQNPMVKPVTRPQTYIYPVDGFYKLTTLFYYNSVKRSMGYKHSVWWNRSNNGHFNALDIACNNGTKVKAVASGTVTSENQGTNHIIVIDHGNMKSLYAHLRKSM